MNNYKINYNQTGGKTFNCPQGDFTTDDLSHPEALAQIITHYRDWGHGDISRNRFPFAKSCQLFVKLKLNHEGMKYRLSQIRRNANLEGQFNSSGNDDNIDYHVSLLQIYINTQHPKFQQLLTNKDQICNEINNNFIHAFREEYFRPGALEKLGDSYIVQKLSIDDHIFNKYVNAKRNFYTYLNNLLGHPTSSEDSQYSPRDGVIKDGKRFFVDSEPFYWIPDFYLTPNVHGTPINNFRSHISVLNISQHSQPITIQNIASYSNNVVIPNLITIDNEFNIKSSISYNRFIEPSGIRSSEIRSSDGNWNTLVNIETYFPVTHSIISLIRGCNT